MTESTPDRPPEPVPAGQFAPVLVQVGDIQVTQFHVVTPNGTYPLDRTTWVVTDYTTYTEAIPPYAIVLAVVFAFACLLGLLFLLIKERRPQGFVLVSVQGPGFSHATQLAPGTGPYAHYQVGYIRNLVAARG
jgi:hypothetical protein